MPHVPVPPLSQNRPCTVTSSSMGAVPWLLPHPLKCLCEPRGYWMHPNHQTYDDSELGSHSQQAGGQKHSLCVKDSVVTGGSRMLPPKMCFFGMGNILG